MNDRWLATYEWMGHIQDELRQQRVLLEQAISLLQGREHEAQALRADHAALSAQVAQHERRLRADTAR